MIQTENNTDTSEKIIAILYQVSELLQDFTREFAEIREFVKKPPGISPRYYLTRKRCAGN